MAEDKPDSKCPKCGGPLVDGYAMAPHGLWWDKEQHRIMAIGGESEKIIPPLSLGIPSAPAQRCYRCNTVTIQVT